MQLRNPACVNFTCYRSKVFLCLTSVCIYFFHYKSPEWLIRLKVMQLRNSVCVNFTSYRSKVFLCFTSACIYFFHDRSPEWLISSQPAAGVRANPEVQPSQPGRGKQGEAHGLLHSPPSVPSGSSPATVPLLPNSTLIISLQGHLCSTAVVTLLPKMDFLLITGVF